MIAVKLALVYLTVNFFILFVFGVLKLANYLGLKFKADIDAGSKLRLHYLMVILIFIVSGITWLLVGHTSNQNVFEPPVKIWAAPSSKEFAKTYLDSNGNGFLSLSDNMSAKAFDGTLLSDVALYGALLGLGILMFMFSRDLFSLKRIVKDSYRLRAVHSVEILINDQFLVPFSFWLPFRRFVVIPSSMLAIDPIFLRCSILHEIQHHRQGDTKMVYLLKLIRVLFPFNFATRGWLNWISEIQEFACDETLIGQSKVESLQYARCLVEVADHALGQTPIPVGAAGVTFLVEQKLLKQRIVKMMSANGYLSAFKQQMFSLVIGGLLVFTLGFSALGVSSVVLDQRISRSKAETLISRMSLSSEFPAIDLNDAVLKQLNRYLGTPEGRQFIKGSLDRYEDYRPMLEEKIKEYNMPIELLAMPIVESGYRNSLPNSTPGHGAGIWMALKSTAISYGLRVDGNVDERLDPKKLTDLAMRYLKSSQDQFGDWRLSILSFNNGPVHVQKAIDELGTRDPWKLVSAGYENDKDYLAKVIAAIIILKNPDELKD